MTLSKTDICNGALLLVGEQTITDLDTDTSEEADVCRVVYDRSRKVLLNRVPWRFSLKTTTLTADVTAVNSLFSASFQLPADFLQMSFSDLDTEAVAYVIEGDRLLANASSVIMTYVSDFVDVGLFSPGFVRTLEYLVASRIAYPLTKDRALTSDILEQYELVFLEEANIDGAFGARNERYILDDFLAVREGALGNTSWSSGT